MTPSEIEKLVFIQIEEAIGQRPSRTALFNDIPVDDIDLICIVMGVEDELGIEIADEEIKSLLSADDLIKLVESKV